MRLPPYATDMDYKRCEKIVKGLLGDEDKVNIQELTLKIMSISDAKGGEYSSEVITTFAKTYINEIL